jgi:dipicolinate synthase subunit A
MGSLAGMKVAVIGGDAREREVILALGASGATVTVAARPRDECAVGEWHPSVGQALTEAEALVLPMPGIDAIGRVYAPLVSETHLLTADDLAQLTPGAPIVVGVARASLLEPAARLGHPVRALADDDEVAIGNSVPTAEGAIQIAMERRPITIHASESLVIGLGRCGLTLTNTLAAMGARVTVVARKPSDRARAAAFGWAAVDYANMTEPLARADFVFNTVPVVVLTAERLSATRPECLIIDLASAPGGTDFAAATALGREAILAPGLPGRVAPVTAGRILARVITAALHASRVEGQ